MKAKIIVMLGILAIALASVGAAQAKSSGGAVHPSPINEYQ